MEHEPFSLLAKAKGRQNRALLAAAVGVLAMVLILISELAPQKTERSASSSGQSASEYHAQLEQRLEKLISQMDGAGKATVMVTLETGTEAVYALDTQSGELQSQNTHVLLNDGSSALTETVCLPQVRGVAVLCDGGGDVRVASRITELIGALLDLPSNRVCVEQRKS